MQAVGWRGATVRCWTEDVLLRRQAAVDVSNARKPQVVQTLVPNFCSQLHSVAWADVEIDSTVVTLWAGGGVHALGVGKK